MSRDIPKSGYNKFAGFSYHELEDLIPPIYDECFDQELMLHFDFTHSEAILKVTNWNDANDFVKYTLPMPEIVAMNKKMNIMQSEGSYITYLKKYLLVNAFLIMEKSTVEQMNPEEDTISSAACNSSSEKVSQEDSSKVTVPRCITKALERITSKGVEINRQTVYAHVAWRQLDDDETLAAKDYINSMEA